MSYNSTNRGGYGGYAYGELNLDKNTIVYVAVGGKGTNGSFGTPNKNAGGYNCGGTSGSGSSYESTASGGGATHIGIKTGLLTEFSSDYIQNLFIVAGGGGGAGCYWENGKLGGNGGGYVGSRGVNVGYGGSGNGGTQNAGGTSSVGTDTRFSIGNAGKFRKWW